MAKKSVLRVKDNPKLGQRTLSDGRISLYLEYYRGYRKELRLDAAGHPVSDASGQPVYTIRHIREKKNLGLYFDPKAKTPEEKLRNKEVLQLAEKVRFEESQKILEDAEGYRLKASKNTDFIAFAEAYADSYPHADKRVMQSALLQFKSFLRECYPITARMRTEAEISAIKDNWCKRHASVFGRRDINSNALFRFDLKANHLTPEMVGRFVDYLVSNLNGESPNNYYNKFKRIVAAATQEGLIKQNPCKGIKCKWDDDGSIKKDFLTADEATRLLQTTYDGQNQEIRRAFALTLLTGLRWCDIRRLTYNNVDRNEINIVQSKTGKAVKVPLRDDVRKLIGTPEESGKKSSDTVFSLPSSTMANKALRHWAKRAGIDKHITWHCGRHTFATLVIDGGANLQVTRELLGHSSFAYLKRYVHALDTAKIAAVESLPTFEL